MKGFAEGHEFGGKGGRGAGLLDAHEFVFELGSSFLVFVNGREFLKEGIVVVKQWRSGFEKRVSPFCRATTKTGYDERDASFVGSKSQ
ncbi:MAG TPA: hypothetical protein VMP68_17810, partial [Candidatus Eisenbacteria bacterium]|nr:hypothetical protein [Candidatus Eisenbacteria bacterium]